MLTLPTCDITLKLMAIQGHVWTKPSLVPHNLVVVVSWHAIGELYHVSWSSDPNADPLWERPTSIGNFVWNLTTTKTWINTGGSTVDKAVKP